MLPAKPPAINAKPMNNNSRAFHATPSWEENEIPAEPSEIRRFLSIRFTIIIPIVEHNPGILDTLIHSCQIIFPPQRAHRAYQSVNVTCTGTGSKGDSGEGFMVADRVHASKKTHPDAQPPPPEKKKTTKTKMRNPNPTSI
ncbi:hypothetical protein PGTUg99_037680 [Puccinia graminis f. sp. tritici]|uniref:Uncharacterized protein n=1 Tax=Puccinia graminis f. sp. tritici TaxID=56615 RepID=A0A5B0SMY1_PUCGR|nr:hypothetical protein PGTUg99_037680 [Puccinia graminis f. sp. tritici]